MAAVTRLLFTLQTIAALPFPFSKEVNFNVKIDDFDYLPYVAGVNRTFHWRKYTGVFNSTKQEFAAFVAVLGDPSFFSVKLPQNGCGHLAQTSVTADYRKCAYATNGGYFSTQTGDCIGNLISDGVSVQVSSEARANFGLTAKAMVVGYMTKDTITAQNFSQLIQGAGWLVRSAESYVNESISIEKLSEEFVNLQAPRTALGAFRNGSIAVFQVDGVEILRKGAKLTDLADWLIGLGVFHAINLDGGGSSTSVYKGEVVDRPTCHDLPAVCQRSVSTITCFSAL